jgi:hypothetical protein
MVCSLWGLAWAEGTEGDGIAKRFDGRNAVLELPIDGARLEDDGDKLAFGTVGLESHTAGCGERNAEDELGLGNVAMPADGGSGWVFGDDGSYERVGQEIGEGGGAVAKREKEFGKWLVGGGGTGGEVVFPTILYSATLGGPWNSNGWKSSWRMLARSSDSSDSVWNDGL